jgi:hypothetical protein
MDLYLVPVAMAGSNVAQGPSNWLKLPSPGPFRLNWEADCELEVVADAMARRRVLVLARRGCPLILNGQPGPCLAVLSAGDVFRFAGDFQRSYYVVEHWLPARRPASATEVGILACRLCGALIEADSIVYVCDCGAVFHAEDGSTRPSPRDIRDCFLAVETCGCGSPIVRRECVVGLPQHLSELEVFDG